MPLTPQNEFIQLIATYVRLHEGRKIMKGNCPFYDDSSGSFMVYPSKEFFKCFGCGVEGGAAEFEKAVKGKPTH